MIFAPDTLPRWPFLPQMRIVHQLREGNANINFYGWGDRFADLVGPVSMELAGTKIRAIPSVNKRKGGRFGLMLTVNTPTVDHFADLDEKLDAVRKGIAETLRLRDWFAAREGVVASWAKLMEE